MQLGLIGLGVMGANLARNAAHRGAKVAVFNRTPDKTDAFLKAHGSEGNFVACHTYEQLKAALTPPRPIVLMVKAGQAVDDVIKELLPVMDKGDILIDAGNSLFSDTQRREKEVAAAGLHFFGMGVSGGEEGALKGPSMMPGGDKQAYESMEPLFKKMAAQDGAGGTCVAHIGPGGAGHFVKMVHNGIEYGIMQLIAETYDLLKSLGRVSNADMGKIFAEWNQGPDLGSFLVEITAQVFAKKDPDTGKDLLDVILDQAGQKGTGKWTTDAAMTLGVPVPTITAAVDARIMSGDTAMRETGKHMPFSPLQASADPREVAIMARSALELSTILSYIQGFELIHRASEEYKWNIDLSEVARIWRGGCIIRSVLLPIFQRAFADDGDKDRAALMDRFSGKRQEHWRRLLTLAVSNGIPTPAMSASLAYYDTYRREKLPQNLIQAQRDLFGAHTFKRTDKEGVFHANWSKE
jgi:6-phosphogluconate dehydrogenase